MLDIVSFFSGVDPIPKGETDWSTVLKKMQSEQYRPYVEKARTLVSDPIAYREYKTYFPSVTFCGNFSKRRNCKNILSATGFIIPDLDHLPDVEKTFNLLSQDEYIWFAFRSPSGDGIKCALRTNGIETDDHIKVFYGAVERYFSITYGIKIDPACKDIARLTFVSYDPSLFINPKPSIFPIEQWSSQEEPRFYLPPSTDNGWKAKYGSKALEGACEKIRQSVKGEQHRERLKQSRLVGGFIASAFIDESNALLALEQAVKDSGARLMGQAMETIRDGIEYGKQSPLQPEEREPVKKKKDIQFYCNVEEVFGDNSGVDIEYEAFMNSQDKKNDDKKIAIDPHETDPEIKLKAQQSVNNEIAKGSIERGNACALCSSNDFVVAHHNDYSKPLDVVWLCRSCHNRLHRDLPERSTPYIKPVSNEGNEGIEGSDGIVYDMKAECKQNVSKNEEHFRAPSPHNLAGTIKEWVENSTGSFTVDQIDREFCLTSRIEKNNRSVVLNRLCVSKKIKKHKNIIGKYEIIDHSLNTVDINNVSEDPFDIELPFDLHRFCTLPQKCIVVLAGSGNAGKTAIALNIAKLNLHRHYKKMYLASEMGGGEIVDRLRRFQDVPFSDWNQVTIAERSFDFASVVESHNPNGLTIIDFLEEIDGEYNKITSQIRAIYDAIGSGVVVVGIQKRNDQDFARGGQGTAEKSRLYVSVDTITVVDNQHICALKIIKMKRWVQRNLNFHELHFKIKYGAEIEVISDWMMLKPGERERYKTIYENKNPEKKKEQMDSWVYQFKLKSGKFVGINEDTFEKWQETYDKLNLYEELDEIANSTIRSPWMAEKNWIYSITGMLAKRNLNK